MPWTICYIIHNQPNLLQSEHNWMHYMDIRHNKLKQPLKWQIHVQIKEWKSKYHHWRLIASTSSFQDQRTKIHHTWRRTQKTINWNVWCFVQYIIIVNSFSLTIKFSVRIETNLSFIWKQVWHNSQSVRLNPFLFMKWSRSISRFNIILLTKINSVDLNLATTNHLLSRFLDNSNPYMTGIMIGTTSFGISYQLRDIYSIWCCCWNVNHLFSPQVFVLR